MLNQLDLKQFKCFKELHLPLQPLTLLTGLNASGKSSVLQALVLLHQTMREHEWSARLMLNGSMVQLRTLADVVDKVNGRNTFEIGIQDDGLNYSWTFLGERSDMSLRVEEVVIGKRKHISPTEFQYLIPNEFMTKINLEVKQIHNLTNRIRKMTYLTAERMGPREVYDLEDRQVATVVGSNGDKAFSVLHWGRDENVLTKLALKNVPTSRFRQVEARMNMFFPGFAMELQQVPRTNALTLGIRTSEDTDFHRPVHVGFGLTQVLPIILISAILA